MTAQQAPDGSTDDAGGSPGSESVTGAGSGDGGTTGTPGTDGPEEPAGGTQEGMVVSGGGLADPSEDDATAAGDRGLG